MAINRSWRVRVSIALLLLTLFQVAQAGSNSLCKAAGYTLGFFNGMWNTRADAKNGLDLLLAVTPSQYNGSTVSGEVFYNHTAAVGRDHPALKTSPRCLSNARKSLIRQGR